MVIDEAVRLEASSGKEGALTPDQFLSTYNESGQNTFLPGSLSPVLGTSNEAFKISADRSFTDFSAGMMHFLYKNVSADQTYNPFKDPVLLAKGDEFVSKYGSFFKDSPNAAYTAGWLKEMEKRDAENTVLANHPVATLTGTILGGLVAPENLALGITSLSGLSKIKAILAGGAQGAALGSTQAFAQGQINPDFSTDDFITTVGATTLLGAAIGFGAASQGKREALKKVINALELDHNDGYLQLTSTVGASQVTNQFAQETVEELSKAAGNPIYTVLQKVGTAFSPLERMINYSSKTLKKLSDEFGYSGVLTKNLDAKPSSIGVQNHIQAGIFNTGQRMRLAMEDILTKATRAGETIDNTKIFKEAWEFAAGVRDDVSTTAKALGGEFRKVFDTYKTKLSNSGILSKDLSGDTNWLPREYDINKISSNITEFKETVKRAIIRKYVNDGKALPEDYYLDDEVNNAVKSIFDTSVRSGSADFTAKNLKQRTIPFTNDEAIKYIKDDVLNITDSYIKRIETQIGLNDLAYRIDPTFRPGEMSVEDVLSKSINDDYDKLINKAGDNLDLVRTLQAERSNATSDVRSMLEMLTGRFDLPDSKFQDGLRRTSRMIRSYQTVRLMGGNLFAQVADAGRYMAERVVDNVKDYLSPLMKGVHKEILKMSPEDRALLGHHLDNFDDFGRAGVLTDLSDPLSTRATKAEKAVDWVVGKFFGATGIKAFHNFSRNIALDDIGTNIIKYSRGLLEDKFPAGSYESIELNKIGLTKDLARKFVKEFDTYKVDASNSLGKHTIPNLKEWNPDISANFIAMSEKQINSRIITNKPGDTPFLMNTWLGKILGQFKTFTLAAYTRGLLPMVQTAAMSKTHAAHSAAKLMFSMAIAGASGIARDAINGKELDITPERMVYYGITRGGVFPVFDMVSDYLDKWGVGIGSGLGLNGTSRYYNAGLLDPFLGPTFSLVNTDIPQAMRGLMDGNVSGKDMRKLIKLMPLQNYFLWSHAVNNIGK